MKIVIDIPDELEKDLIITAYEGGSSYWAELSLKTLNAVDATVSPKCGLAPSERLYQAMQVGKSFEINDSEDSSEVLGSISKDGMATAWQTLSEKYPEVLGEILAGNWDASSADTFFQLAVLGEIVYG